MIMVEPGMKGEERRKGEGERRRWEGRCLGKVRGGGERIPALMEQHEGHGERGTQRRMKKIRFNFD